MKAIYFDMDGTIADLYGFEGWLDMLHAEDTTPYEMCEPCVDMIELAELLNEFIQLGIRIGVISWAAMGGSKQYGREVKKAKRRWCEQYLDCVSEFHVVKYGTPKHYVRKEKDSVLVDDDEKVRKAWKGETIDARENILEQLRELLVRLENENDW